MIKVNSLSGGQTSSYMAVHYPADVNIFACVCIDYHPASPKDPAVYQYCLDKLNGNFIASSESEKTLKVLMQLEQKIGKEIIWVRGKSFDQIIDGAGCLPTWSHRFCTVEMKIKPIFEYLYPRYGVVREQIGFRYDESHRAYKTENELSIFELLDLFGNIHEAKTYIKKKYRKVDSIMTDYPISTNIFGSKRNNLSDILWAKKSYPMIDDLIDRIEVIGYWRGFPDFDFPLESNCQGCPNKRPETIHRQFFTEVDILTWFSLQEKKKFSEGSKIHTWHDDQVSYEAKRDMSFTELLSLQGSGSCDSGYCLMD